MVAKNPQPGFTPQEHRISVLSSSGAAILILIFLVGSGMGQKANANPVFLLGLGTIGAIYLIGFNFFIVPSFNLGPIPYWVNAIIVGTGLGLLTFALPDFLGIYIDILLIVCVITSALLSGRGPSYFLLGYTALITMAIHQNYPANIDELKLHVTLFVVAMIIIESIVQLERTSHNHIRRLEIITEFSRSIAPTLERKQVMTLLSKALQNSIDAETYFIGTREGNEMCLEILFDDGEFYENQRVKLDGSLSGWVFNNQKSLFLPDLRKEVDLPGMRLVLVGRHKTSLSWMGVPMRGQNMDGIIAIGSYRPNAFDLADLELLTALAQHAAQAIDNAHRHAEVELQSHLDSLTNIYNHGYFLELLENSIGSARMEQKPLSVIMLDIDHFKQYNDIYGHLSGDEILRNLCSVIKGHLKCTDIVGRWGGEEFVIALPNANGKQAHAVAERIRHSMLQLSIHNHKQATIPSPTISQGIAVYPLEANKTIELIDLADKRLYIAKKRGRNQVEPDEHHWQDFDENMKSEIA